MMNVVALCLVLSSLLAAEVWSPNPGLIDGANQKDDVVVKEGHRVVVVEYEQDDKPKTKVSISPTTHHKEEEVEGVFRDLKEKIKETASFIPNVGQGISQPEEEKGIEHEHRAMPGELICDALGKCTHKIASAIGRAKDKVSRAAHDKAQDVKETVIEKAQDVGETAAQKADDVKERVTEKARDVKEKAFETVHDVSEGAAKKAHEKAQEVKERVSEKARDVSESAAKKAHDVKEKVTEKARDITEEMGKTAHDVKERAFETAAEKARDVSETADDIREKTAHKAEKAKEGVKGWACRLFNAAKRGGRAALRPSTVGGVMGLLGFATAYGACVWVTFVSSYVLASVLPKQQFGLVQSKIYPVYFRAMGWSIAVALMGHLLGQSRRSSLHQADMSQGFILLASLLMVLANALYLEPRATKVMFERLKLEKEEGRGGEGVATDLDVAAADTTVPPSGRTVTEKTDRQTIRWRMEKLREQLKRLNSYSSWLNILNLMCLTWHLVYLGQRLSVTC